MTKKTVAILFGGTNSEHEVSLMSATSVLSNINREKYDVVTLGITREGHWLKYSGPISDIIGSGWENHPDNVSAVVSPDRSTHGLLCFGKSGVTTLYIDVAFPVMHGKFAEDGSMQGLFELAGIPFVGAGVTSSAICMDKEYMHMVLDSVGIKTSKWFSLRHAHLPQISVVEQRIEKELGGYPIFIKPANAGSSVGVSKVKSPGQLEEAMKSAFSHDEKIIVEAMTKGKEIECAVLGNENPIASAHCGEVVPKLEFYDYNSKYYDDTAALYLPARIEDEETELIRATAIKAYRALDCRGLTRMDFFLTGDGSCVLNEPNTLPGFTHISMYPKLFIDSGIGYSDLLDRLLQYAQQ